MAPVQNQVQATDNSFSISPSQLIELIFLSLIHDGMIDSIEAHAGRLREHNINPNRASKHRNKRRQVLESYTYICVMAKYLENFQVSGQLPHGGESESTEKPFSTQKGTLDKAL